MNEEGKSDLFDIAGIGGMAWSAACDLDVGLPEFEVVEQGTRSMKLLIRIYWLSSAGDRAGSRPQVFPDDRTYRAKVPPSSRFTRLLLRLA